MIFAKDVYKRQVLYRRDLSARMIVEYKAPHIEITKTVFDQITRYNMVLKVDYLIVSNGIDVYKRQAFNIPEGVSAIRGYGFPSRL